MSRYFVFLCFLLFVLNERLVKGVKGCRERTNVGASVCEHDQDELNYGFCAYIEGWQRCQQRMQKEYMCFASMTYKTLFNFVSSLMFFIRNDVLILLFNLHRPMTGHVYPFILAKVFFLIDYKQFVVSCNDTLCLNWNDNYFVSQTVGKSLLCNKKYHYIIRRAFLRSVLAHVLNNFSVNHSQCIIILVNTIHSKFKKSPSI